MAELKFKERWLLWLNFIKKVVAVAEILKKCGR